MLFDRRNFLKSLGIISGSTLVSCNTMAPRERLEAYLSPPREMVPGRAAYYATVCRACPAGCGILVKTREGRPIKLEGNPSHPINRGRLCARGQAFVEDLYNRNRVQTPIVDSKETSWSTAMSAVSSKLRGARSVGFLTGLESPTFDHLVSDLSRTFPSSVHMCLEPMTLVSIAEASKRLFGKHEVPRIDLSTADYVVSLGADFLDAWVSPVELTGQFAARHSAVAGRALTLSYIGPHRNLTATAADRWLYSAADEMGPIALSILYGVFQQSEASLVGPVAMRIKEMMKKLGPVPSETAIPQKSLTKLVKELTRAREGLVLFGGASVLGQDATVIHAAVLLTNYLLGAMGKQMSYGQGYVLSKADPEKAVLEWLRGAGGATPDVLFITGANPAYTLPGGAEALEVLSKTTTVVALAHSHDETSDLADIVLPVHHPLESWGDYDVTSGIAGLMQPVRAPLYHSRHVGDVLIQLGAAAGKLLRRAAYKDYLVHRWTRLGKPAAAPSPVPELVPDAGMAVAGPGPSDAKALIADRAWEKMLVEGGRFTEPTTQGQVSLDAGGALDRIAAAAQPNRGDAARLIVHFSASMYDGRGATLDWLRETPDPILQTAWDIPVQVARDVADKQGISDGDIVRLKGPAGEMTVKAIIAEDLLSGSVALALGGGRVRARYAEETGHVLAIMPALFDPLSGELAWAGAAVSMSRLSDGRLASVMGSPKSEGRLLVLEMGLQDFRSRRFPILTRHGDMKPGEAGADSAHRLPMPYEEKGGTRPADNMYSLPEHKKHRWGLTVDLDKCTGCSACAVACFAENNIPVVGKEEIYKGRELSWMRIEKHVFKTGAVSRVRFLPVMCQQCDNAPCETVCPVFASSHTADGLNAQIYNRCVGTRYCANNCPYKVRRFNYYDYSREKPANQQLNPDVTVRSRGVMEKCTFCIQRIREVQNRKRLQGEKIQDGDIVPACVETCPAGALSFGDFKQPEGRMSKLARDPRAYRLLDYTLNTRPGVVYLRKVVTDEGPSNGE